jgi:SAM-dependent methyltransferase
MTVQQPESPKAYGWKSAQPTNSVDYCKAAIAKHLSRLGCKRVLDIGCGNGAMTSQLAADGFEMTAIEPDRDGFTIATQTHPGIHFENRGVYDNLDDLGIFDAVISSEVIEHLFDPSALVKAAWSRLPKNGVLIITCPYYGYVKNLVLSLGNRWDDHHQPARIGGHIKLWSRATMVSFLSSSGFDVDAVGGAGRFAPIWKSMVVVAKKKSG